jgi:hypothetical protein
VLSLRAMTTLDYAPEREVSQERARRIVEAIKPPRLNFARRCMYCLARDCDSLRCEALYELSRWAICPDCDGREGDEITSERCEWCTLGVVEIAPMAGPGVEGLDELR